jgi:ethanolamine utilization microcompartment shell protein EutS
MRYLKQSWYKRKEEKGNRKNMKLSTIAIATSLVAAAAASKSNGLTHSYTDPDLPFKIQLDWGFPTNSTIKFRLTTPGEFYAGLGFGNSGKMADMQVGWIDRMSGPVVIDFFEEHGAAAPHTDISLGGNSDLTDIEAFEKDYMLTIGFTRKLDTGDKFDKKLDLSLKQDFVWAFCSKDYFCDAAFPGDLQAFHGQDGRGVIFGIDLLSNEYKI